MILVLALKIQYQLDTVEALIVERQTLLPPMTNLFLCACYLSSNTKVRFLHRQLTSNPLLLNVWMTSHHGWIKGGTVKDSAVPGISPVSDSSCLCMLLIPRNDVTLESSNHSRWWIYKLACPTTCHASLLYLRLPPLCSLAPTYAFSVSLIISTGTVH